MTGPADLRLLDAITIKYGPVEFLSRFFLEADEFIRSRGIRLTVRSDFEELSRLNEKHADDSWHALVRAFDSRYSDVSRENAYWIAGIDEDGEMVSTQCGRFFNWPDSCFADHVEQLMYGDRASGANIHIDAPAARFIRGKVIFNGGAWIHPKYRRRGVASLAAKVGRLFGTVTWGCDWICGALKQSDAEIGMHKKYGFSQISFGIHAPGSPWGDAPIGVPYQNPMELLAEAELFMQKQAARRAEQAAERAA